MRLRNLVNSTDMTLNLRNAVWALPYLSVMGFIWGYLAGGSDGVLVGLAVAIGVSATIGSAASILSSAPVERTVNRLYGLDRQTTGPRQRLSGDLNVARYHKLCHRFEHALLALETVLAEDPDDSEALFLKAQILWEGFNDRHAAQQTLMRIIQVEGNEKAVFRRWALNFSRELSEMN